MYRRRVLAGLVEARLKEIVVEVVDEAGGEVIEVEVMADHVHLLVEVPPAVGLSRLLQSLKVHIRRSRPARSQTPQSARAAQCW